MTTTRGERRHHEWRIKQRWRRRLARCKPWGPITAEQHARWKERMVVRRAHHNKCPCGICMLKLPGAKHPNVRVRDWWGEME